MVLAGRGVLSYIFMKNGNWTAIRDGVVDKIELNGPASIGDFVLIANQLYKQETPTSVSLLAKRLCWSRRKTGAWLKKIGLEIEYFGKTMGPSKGILKTIPREELDPKNEGIWVVQLRGRS
jgi:hypothetical protein